jgi:hypothetical protein
MLMSSMGETSGATPTRFASRNRGPVALVENTTDRAATQP